MGDWKRTYRAVWLANLITSVGMMSFLPFFPSLLEEMGVSGDAAVRAWAGAIFGAAPLSATLMSPIWGALGDRLGRKLMVCRAMFAIALFVGGMYFVSTPLQLLAMRIGQGLFSGFIPPSITLVSVAAPPSKQGRVAADLTTALALGGMLGPMLGGWIFTVTGSHRTVFLFVGAAALVSAGLVAFFAEENPDHRQRAAGRHTLKGMLAGTGRDLRQVFANPTMRGMALLLFALQFGLGAVNPVLELLVRDQVSGEHLGAWAWVARWMPGVSVGSPETIQVLATSVLFGGMAVCNLISLPLWGRYGDRVGHRKALAYCALGSLVSLIIQASTNDYSVLFLGRMLMGVAMAGTGPLAFGLAAGQVGAERRGGAFGVVFSARTLAVAVGAAVGGVLSSVIGVRGLMWLSAVVLGAVLLQLRASGARATGSVARRAAGPN